MSLESRIISLLQAVGVDIKALFAGVAASAPIAHVGDGASAHAAVTTTVNGFMSAADKVKLNGVATGATANTGTVTGVAGTAPIVSSGGTAPAISIVPATTSVPGSMSAADKTKLDSVATNANAYVHPTGDGNLHVPATGTTNSGKVLTAGVTAGALTWETSAGGSGLTNFTESVNTASPNATIPVVSLLATGAAAAVDVVIGPKSNGALLAQVPNGTVTGGNKRGGRAVDWQTKRNNAPEVASGVFSVIGGGEANRATANYCAIVGGLQNTASGPYATVVGGFNNLADGATSYASGKNASTRGIIGANVWGFSGVGVRGTHQIGQYLLQAATSDATPRVLTTDALTASSANTVCLPNNSSYTLRLRVIARNTATGISKSWLSEVLINRASTAASIAFDGTPDVEVSSLYEASLSGASVAVTADTTIGGLGVTVTGIAATNLRWLAHVEALEVTN